MRLAVELYGTSIGTLEGDARTFDFTPSDAAIERFGANSPVLSVAIPMTPTQRRDRAGRRRNWFGELLPEGDQYGFMLAQASIRRGDTPAFLAHYGRDVAGALQIWNLDDPTEPKRPSLHPVDAAQIRALLEDPIRSPLGNDPRLGKTSLGGVQPKIALTRTRKGWAQALGGSPTTHILKPQLAERPTMIFDEEYGARLVRGLWLASFETRIEAFDGLPTLVIERFDRRDGERVHQEDFNQALGGVVSLQRVAAEISRSAPGRSLRSLAEMVTLSVAIGNLDLHTKNLGLLHPVNGDVELAPAYDVVPHAHFPGDGRLALAVNGVYRLAEVERADLVAEFTTWGLQRADAVVTETLERLDALVTVEQPLNGAAASMHAQIQIFIANLLSGRAMGAGG
ncbi:type II toxin-antitoxin system HipA family toxin [Microbacterium sp. 22195]|uniref:type II toxin-antitoxin system HipA family toxin n=1 Tax=Microbacterium sp. 22195 TaxID=3453891 RepID=UPI003F855A52